MDDEYVFNQYVIMLDKMIRKQQGMEGEKLVYEDILFDNDVLIYFYDYYFLDQCCFFGFFKRVCKICWNGWLDDGFYRMGDCDVSFYGYGEINEI